MSKKHGISWNHGLMDGYHVGKFYQELQYALNTLK